MYTTVQIVQRLSPGGIETLALDFAKHAKADEENYIISLEGSRGEMLAKWPRLNEFREKIFFLDKPAKFCLATLWRLSKLVRRLRANCIHTHHIGPLLYGSLAAHLASTRKHIHTEHDAWHLENSKHKILQQFLVRLFTPVLIADSALVAEKLTSKIGSIKVNTIYNGIDTNKFVLGDQKAARSKLNLPENQTIIGCAGRLEQVKGQSLLIDALLTLPENVHIAFAGVGSLEAELKALANKLKLTQRVHFLGLVEEMPAFYQSLDLFCLPSFNEGFPLSPLEAQACGIPCVITDTGASSEAVCATHCQLVDVGSTEHLSEKLLQVLMTSRKKDDSTHSQYHSISKQLRDFAINIASMDLMLNAYRSLKLQYTPLIK